MNGISEWIAVVWTDNIPASLNRQPSSPAALTCEIALTNDGHLYLDVPVDHTVGRNLWAYAIGQRGVALLARVEERIRDDGVQRAV